MTFCTDIEGFKRAVAEFCKAAPQCDDESLENGWKAIGLLYLGVQEQRRSDLPIAVSYLNYASRRYFDRVLELAA